MSASEHLTAPRTVRGVMVRVGYFLASLGLVYNIQPFIADARTRADHHFELKVGYLDQAGIMAGLDTNGPAPGDQELIAKAHAEKDAGKFWNNIALAEGGAALVVVAGAIVAGSIAARRQEANIAMWSAVTSAAAASEH